ncbi:MAG: aldo/keto reductase [Acidobacteria bacterium]|nr:aldo/keto reductase [Acidobacteriota bacterium]
MKRADLNRRAFLKTATAGAVSAALSGVAGRLARAVETAGEIPMRTLGKTGLRVTMIGLGGYHAGLPEKEEDSIAIIHRALDLGINFFDNADCYQEGRAEERMGKALEGRRDKIYLMTKVDQRDAEGSREQLEKTLRRLRTDYLDIWQFHAVGKLGDLDKIFGPGGALETAERARKEGKIRFIGVTGHLDPVVHFEALQRYPFDSIQMPVNVVDPHFRSFRRTVVEEAGKRNVGIIAMKTLSFGNILSKGVAKVAEALPWVWSQPVSVLVSGCDTIERLDYNVYLAKTFKPMPETEQAALLERTKARAGTEVENYKTRS